MVHTSMKLTVALPLLEEAQSELSKEESTVLGTSWQRQHKASLTTLPDSKQLISNVMLTLYCFYNSILVHKKFLKIGSHLGMYEKAKKQEVSNQYFDPSQFVGDLHS